VLVFKLKWSLDPVLLIDRTDVLIEVLDKFDSVFLLSAYL